MVNFKKNSALLEEVMEKHRELKVMVMVLLEQSNKPNMTKEKMSDEVFKIYMELK